MKDNKDFDADFQAGKQALNKAIKPTKLYGCIEVTTGKNRFKKADKLPPVKQFFGSLLTDSGRLAIIFGDTGAGKTLLATLIANNIAKGKGTLELPNDVGITKAFYLDLEMDDRQFGDRYRYNRDGINDEIDFSDNLELGTLNFEGLDEGKKVSEQLILSIEEAIKTGKYRLVFIDNLTLIATDQEKSENAKELIIRLKRLAKRLDTKIILIAHTPKITDTRPILIDDLAGSKNFSNLVDEVFAVGKSHKDFGLRYIKQLKTRIREGIEFGFDNVLVYTLGDTVGLRFVGFDEEGNHLQTPSNAERQTRNEEIIRKAELGMSQSTIASELGMSRVQVNRIIQKFKKGEFSK